jgi:hypothetical protein
LVVYQFGMVAYISGDVEALVDVQADNRSFESPHFRLHGAAGGNENDRESLIYECQRPMLKIDAVVEVLLF